MFKFADITISKTLVAQKSKHISIYHDSSNLTTFIHHTLNKIFQGPPRKPSIIFPLKSQPASSVISLAFQHMFTVLRHQNDLKSLIKDYYIEPNRDTSHL
ncbi:unnamed protein product [Brassica rapa subsp. trilocularis]